MKSEYSRLREPPACPLQLIYRDRGLEMFERAAVKTCRLIALNHVHMYTYILPM